MIELVLQVQVQLDYAAHSEQLRLALRFYLFFISFTPAKLIRGFQVASVAVRSAFSRAGCSCPPIKASQSCGSRFRQVSYASEDFRSL